MASRFHWNDSEGVPRYDAQGVNTETAAVEAAGIFHEFLEVIVMEGACLLPFVRRAGHVSLTINRSRHAIFHVFDDSEVLQSILLCSCRCYPDGEARHQAN